MSPSNIFQPVQRKQEKGACNGMAGTLSPNTNQWKMNVLHDRIDSWFILRVYYLHFKGPLQQTRTVYYYRVLQSMMHTLCLSPISLHSKLSIVYVSHWLCPQQHQVIQTWISCRCYYLSPRVRKLSMYTHTTFPLCSK